MQGYCVKCQKKREMKNAKSVTMENGNPATQGVCQVCGTKMFRIGENEDRAVLGVTKAVSKPGLSDVAADKAFWCHDGRVMKNLDELSVALREMSEDTFRYHVTEDKNDFSKWVEDVIGDHELSAALKNSSTRGQAGELVAGRSLAGADFRPAMAWRGSNVKKGGVRRLPLLIWALSCVAVPVASSLLHLLYRDGIKRFYHVACGKPYIDGKIQRCLRVSSFK